MTTAVLWVAVLSGPVAIAGLALGGSTSSPVIVATAPQGGVAASTPVGEFAESYVMAWSRATGADSTALEAYVGASSLLSLPAVAPEVSDPAVASVHAVSPGLWAVVVAVTVADPPRVPFVGDPGVGGGAGGVAEPVVPAKTRGDRRYFAVSIASTGDGDSPAMSALTLPAPVPGPVIGAGSTLAYDGSAVSLSGALALSVQGFVNALLTGQGDLARYLSPSLRLSAIEPAPYVSARVTDVRADRDTTDTPADGTLVHLLVTVDLGKSAGAASDRAALSAQYPLSVTARAGRWEVSAIDPAPRIDPGAPRPAAS